MDREEDQTVIRKSACPSWLFFGVYVCLLVVGLSAEGLADEIEFKNGAILNGTVTRQDSTTVSVSAGGIVETYARADIRSVRIESEAPLPPTPLSVDRVEPDSTAGDAYGVLNPERAGFRVADTDNGTLNISVWSYVRYINQLGLDDTYTDGSGVEKTVEKRRDIQYSKVSIQFKGWVLDERLRYLAYVWASPNVMGKATAFALVGNIEFRITDHLVVGGGIQGLPTSRAMELSHPRFNRVDVRSMGGEYFRGSYAAGVWLEGEPVEDLYFRTVLANSLSKLGVDAGQLDGKLATWSTGAWWSPKGGYAVAGMKSNGGGYGDFENHQSVAIRLGAHYTTSIESAQSQPDVDDPENSQIRLSDGRLIFESPEVFNGAYLDEVRYQMVAMDAGLKYRGAALEGEVYFRHLDRFRFREGSDPGDLGFSRLIDTGWSIQPSYMVLREKLQVYVIGSVIYGDYGDPWDGVVGLNWFPVRANGLGRQFRINGDAQYTSQSPIGNLSLPYTVGGRGWTYSVSAELFF
ncbi:MAG: hypothetical protein DRP71_15985 [Verrucomicrobia bacterium]|nr:MAG: hypothetical protein DRP71_15985 [Verrucomicrobiota bacterium]